MPCRKQYCPACGLQAMKCVKSISTGLDGHPLESGRVSSWRCESCGAAWQLETPEGRLLRVRRPAHRPTAA